MPTDIYNLGIQDVWTGDSTSPGDELDGPPFTALVGFSKVLTMASLSAIGRGIVTRYADDNTTDPLSLQCTVSGTTVSVHKGRAITSRAGYGWAAVDLDAAYSFASDYTKPYIFAYFPQPSGTQADIRVTRTLPGAQIIIPSASSAMDGGELIAQLIVSGTTVTGIIDARRHARHRSAYSNVGSYTTNKIYYVNDVVLYAMVQYACLLDGTVNVTPGTDATKWAVFGGGGTNPLTTLGDLIYGGTSGVQTRLAGNTTTSRKFLRQTGDGTVSAAPVWDALQGADVPVFGASGTTHAPGAVPDPGATAGTTRYLREDGTWVAPPGGGGGGGAGYGGTSTTSNTPGTGSKTFTTQAGLAYTVGASRVRIADASNSANYVEGLVTAYNSTSGVLTVNADASGGSGTISSWNLSIIGQPGVNGTNGTNGAAGAAGATGATGATGAQGPSGPAPRTITQTAHGLSVGNFIYETAADVYAKAQADTDVHAEVIGYVTAVADANTFTYALPGSVLTGLSSLAFGSPDGPAYFLSQTTAGAYTGTDAATGTIRRVLFIAINATTAFFVNEPAVRISAATNLTTLATVTGINAKTVGVTSLYTVPTGKTAVITGAIVRCAAATAITNGPALGIGVASGEDDIYASTAINALTTTAKVFGFSTVGMSVSAAAGAVVKVGIDTAATGTSQTIAIDLLGYLI